MRPCPVQSSPCQLSNFWGSLQSLGQFCIGGNTDSERTGQTHQDFRGVTSPNSNPARGIPLQEIGARLGKVLGCWRKQFEGVTIGIIKVQRPARHPTVEDGPDNLDTFLLE